MGLQRVRHDWATNTFTFILKIRFLSDNKPCFSYHFIFWMYSYICASFLSVSFLLYFPLKIILRNILYISKLMDNLYNVSTYSKDPSKAWGRNCLINPFGLGLFQREWFINFLFSSLFMRIYSGNSDNFVKVKKKPWISEIFFPTWEPLIYLSIFAMISECRLVNGWFYHSFCNKYGLHHFTKGLPWKLTFIWLSKPF